MKKIQNCKKCDLYKNQLPLLQNVITKNEVMFVGLSAIKTIDIKKDEPFSATSKSGALLREISKDLPDCEIYFTNIVKCLPLTDKKIRYPTNNELDACFANFVLEVESIKPKKIVLFGKRVSDHIIRQLGLSTTHRNDCFFDFKISYLNDIQIMNAYHPSYILVYKRKNITDYKKSIVKFIKQGQNSWKKKEK